MKPLWIEGTKETPEQFAHRCTEVDDLIASNWQKATDFEIGLLATPPLKEVTIKLRRLHLRLLRPKGRVEPWLQRSLA